MSCLVEIGPVGMEKKIKMQKVLKKQRLRLTWIMDKLWSEMLTWAFGSGELKKTNAFSPYNWNGHSLVQMNPCPGGYEIYNFSTSSSFSKPSFWYYIYLHTKFGIDLPSSS